LTYNFVLTFSFSNLHVVLIIQISYVSS